MSSKCHHSTVLVWYRRTRRIAVSTVEPNWHESTSAVPSSFASRASRISFSWESPTMPKQKAAEPLFEQLSKTLETDGEDLVSKLKGLVLFKIDDEEWTLDLRSGKGKVSKGGAGSDKPDLTLTISDDNFVKLVMGKMGPQQAFLLRKLKIGGSMGMALKLQPILDAAQPKSKM